MRRIFLLFFLSAVIAKAQMFTGEVFLRDNSALYLNQVYVTNLTEHKTVLSDFSGKFSINAKAGDVIRFTSIVTERKDVTVTENMLQGKNNFLELKIAYHDIQEVFISRFKPTGNLRRDVASLKTGQKKMELQKMIGLPEPKGDGTPPQLPVASLAGGGLTFSIESIYDILSGERKKKERYYAYEKMNFAISEVKKYFGKDYFLKLKIPENLTDNFLQFVYTSDNFSPQIEAKNMEAVKIYIERYLPIYQKRLENSQLLKVIK